jgi:hypothetical protein
MDRGDKKILDEFEIENAREEERAAMATAIGEFSNKIMPKVMAVVAEVRQGKITRDDAQQKVRTFIQKLKEDRLRRKEEREEREKKEGGTDVPLV